MDATLFNNSKTFKPYEPCLWSLGFHIHYSDFSTISDSSMEMDYSYLKA